MQATSGGKILTGVLRSDDAQEVLLVNAIGELAPAPKSGMEEGTRGAPAMPSDLVS